MGYVLGHSHCVGCGQIFSYNPVHVPSIRINGVREPIRQHCAAAANPRRVAAGLDPIEPHPEAYQACPEEEVPWEDD
jgi:hypothetical protein